MAASSTGWFRSICGEERFQALHTYLEPITGEEASSLFIDPSSDENPWLIFEPQHRLLAKLFFKLYADRIRGLEIPRSSPFISQSWRSDDPDHLQVTTYGYLALGSCVQRFSDSGTRQYLTPGKLVGLISELSVEEREKVIALYLENCTIDSIDLLSTIFPKLALCPNLRHINLSSTRVEYSDEFAASLKKLLERGITIDPVATQFTSIDSKKWFHSIDFTPKCAQHLIWIIPSQFAAGGWKCLLTDQIIVNEVEAFHCRWAAYR